MTKQSPKPDFREAIKQAFKNPSKKISYSGGMSDGAYVRFDKKKNKIFFWNGHGSQGGYGHWEVEWSVSRAKCYGTRTYIKKYEPSFTFEELGFDKYSKNTDK